LNPRLPADTFMDIRTLPAVFRHICGTPKRSPPAMARSFNFGPGLLLAAMLACITATGLAAQANGNHYEHDTEAPVANAVRTTQPIVIDGVLDEAVWMTAPAITDFVQTDPDEGAPVSQPTEVRFLFDDENIYVGAWLWDDGEILTRLARRDAGVPDADFFVVLFDSYHDHRTAYRFSTSPSGMKRDEIVTGGYGGMGPGGGGGFGDTSWDPVWEIRTSITDEGWFVEMRIPFSQLRYRPDEAQTWGLQVERKIRRHGEDTVWAFTPRRERGGVARFGHLAGVEGIRQGKRLELLPFVTGRAEFVDVPRSGGAEFDNPFRSGSDVFGNLGADLKYRISSNLTLDATVNPDFGQVEMDPAVINLSAFETRFDEKRPFFVEGAEIFRFGETGGNPGATNAQLLYSRRIGRAPQGRVPGSSVYSDVPSASTILGAAKLTGKSANGWSMGILNAVTGRVHAPWMDTSGAERTTEVEPLANYFAGRVRRDVRQGSAAFGAIATAVHRSFDDDALRSQLRSAAYAIGMDGRLDWSNRAWMMAGRISRSHIEGSPAAMEATQRSSARYMQRPDAEHVSLDPTATSLSGYFGRVDLARQAGIWQGRVGITAITPGYEVNDLGFQSWADRIDVDTNFGYEQPRANSHFRRFSVRGGPSATFNFAGEPVSADFGLFVNGQLLSQNGFNVRMARQFAVWNDRLTRGGPLTREPAGYSGNLGFNTDSRGRWQVRSGLRFAADDGGGWRRGANFNVGIRIGESYEVRVGPDVSFSHTPAQYVTTIGDPTAAHTFGSRYVFAGLDQTTVGVETRFNFTFTPDLTLELYAQPFLSTGDYHPFKELALPRTFEFLEYGTDVGTVTREDDGRYTIDPHGDGTRTFRVTDRDFNYRSLLGNAVLRYEWRPGSTLYLVWQQAREERLTSASGDTAGRRIGAFDLERDARALFGIKPRNVLMLKVNYWLNP
jgi:hypothetical protein